VQSLWVIGRSRLGIVDRFLESAYGFAERLAELRKFAWAEDQQGHDKYYDQFWSSKTAEHALPPAAEITLRYGLGVVNLGILIARAGRFHRGLTGSDAVCLANRRFSGKPAR
jgi:hypothetical protein